MLAESEAPPSPTEPDLDEALFETGTGERWVARVLGRAKGSGPEGAATPLLLLGLWPEADTAEARPVREVYVVSRTLERLTEEALLRALDRARPFVEQPSAPPTGRESRRGRRR